MIFEILRLQVVLTYRHGEERGAQVLDDVFMEEGGECG